MNKKLDLLFSPKSIALIGASSSSHKVGAILLKNIIGSGFTGNLYPINLNTEHINGLKCYKKISDLPEIVDLALVAIPAAGVNQVLTEIGENGIKNVVVFAAGFKETGLEGKNLEDELIRISQKYKLNLLGPNCLGFVNKNNTLNATFGQPVREKGNLRFITQSGALATSIFDYCNSTGLGFSEFVTLGNKSIINENDVLFYFLEKDIKNNRDKQIEPIGLYLESISDGKEFVSISSRLSKKDPLFIIKPGKSTAAFKAMQSHTGAIAGEDVVLESALSSAGIVRCSSLESFFDLAKAFAWEQAPIGPNVAIVSNAGGPAVISVDAVIKEGLKLVELDAKTKEKLHKILPPSAAVGDPVDILGDALFDRFSKACEIVLETKEVHSLLVILTPQIMTQIINTVQAIGSLSKKHNKPIFCAFIGGNLVAKGYEALNKFRVPSFQFPERAIAVMGMMWKWKKWQQEKTFGDNKIMESTIRLDTEKISQIIENAVKTNQNSLDNFQADKLLNLSGINTPPTEKIISLENAKRFAEKYGWPIVFKLSSSGLVHKADVGGVLKNISAENLEKAKSEFDVKVSKAPDLEIQIQKQIEQGIEVIIGIKKDPTFGPVILFGAGGSMAEFIEDKNLELFPITLEKIKKMVIKSKIYEKLKNYDVLDKLYDSILRLSLLYPFLPVDSEIEINPLIVTESDVWAVDGKVIFKKQEKQVLASNFQSAEVIECKLLAGKFFSFFLKAEKPFVYKPGQYISVKVSDKRINCYSIVSSEKEGMFSLLVDTSPGGIGSKYFEKLKVGDRINFLGPFGIFTQKPERDTKRVLFLGTGSGCAPLRCMVDNLLKVDRLENPITLYLGLRYKSDIFWKEYFDKLSKEHPNFNYVFAISKPDGETKERTGHITDCVRQDFPDMSGMTAYLCGNKNMIEEATNILVSQGLTKDRIYSEKF